MSRRPFQDEDGQVLIQVSIMIVVLLGFVALAVDVGHLYGERRRMQNAADAAALAGARELCLTNYDAAAATGAAETYLLENDAVLADSLIQFPQSHVIEVLAGETTDTFLARVFGDETAEVGATAAAACGAATSACGLWPITFERVAWENLECGEQFAVWNDETKDITCQWLDAGGAVQTSDTICDCYDCDFDDNGEDDISVVSDTSRGWLDLSAAADEIYTDPCTAEGCGTSELACQIRSTSGAKISVAGGGICIAGARGVRAGVKDDVDARRGDSIGVLLYDDTNCSVDNNCLGTDADSYFVTKIGCITVDGWEQNFTLDWDRVEEPVAAQDKKVTGKAILTTINCNGGCFSACGGTDGTAAEPWEVRAVSLIQ